MAKSRARPAAVEALAMPPPAKRRKPLPDARSNGLASILLNNKSGKKLAPAYTTKPSRSSTARVNDKSAVVSTADSHGNVDVSGVQDEGAEVVEISSDSTSDSDEDEDTETAAVAEVSWTANGTSNGILHDDSDDERPATENENNQDEEMGEDAANEEATFGERLQAQNAEPIDVETALAKAGDESSDETRKPRRLPVKVPSAATFSSVLSQALNTNDHVLLESCFETADLESVRETISRLDSRHIVSLLQRIAERISKRPGRLGNLMVWVQWSIIAHGGYLAGQPDIVSQLGTLNRVIKARADGLQPLLQLKGKLDMLSAQLDLRRDIQERNARDEGDEEGAVTVYVEGEQDDEAMSDDEGSEIMDDERQLLLKDLYGADIDDEALELGTFTNGIIKGDVEASESSGAEEGLFDDEADETDNDDEEESDSDEGAASALDDEDSG
jgi:U3 small nucleolar RNA-associated protein 5